MASKKLIYADDARRAILHEEPKLAYCIERIKAVDAVEVVHGRWISYLDGDSIMPERHYRCSECCDRGWGRKWPYCPNCGAKMDKTENP